MSITADRLKTRATESCDHAPNVDVVILSWNDDDLLPGAVESALRSTGVEVNVIVIDNGSLMPAAVIADPRVNLIRNNSNLGVAPGRNQGVAVGRSEFICLLDSDARLLANTLAGLAAQCDGRVGLAAPVFVDQEPEDSAGRAPGIARKAARVLGLTRRYGRARPRSSPRAWKVDFAIGACQLFRREAFDSVGGLDDSIFYGPEDIDFCLRLSNAGWQVVQTDLVSCRHPPRRRNRRILSRRGMAHTIAVLRHLFRHGGSHRPTIIGSP